MNTTNKLPELFDNNRAWAKSTQEKTPDFFSRLAKLQAPDHLWIGCADSRVSANEITGLLPGEIFVHRNIANVVVPTDLNCLSVLQYAVDVLKVKHVIVVGHYGCGGIQASTESKRHGLIDNWLRHIQDVTRLHEEQLSAITDKSAYLERLCELNVIEQVVNVCRTNIVADAWEAGQELSVHGWVYRIGDGLLRDLGITVSRQEDFLPQYQVAIRPESSPAAKERITPLA